MKYLFIGDIHSNISLMESITEFGINNDYHMVFVGDYVDSWERDPYNGIECLDLIVKLSNDHTFLIGNHDINYLYPKHHYCVGYIEEYQDEYQSRLRRANLKYCFGVDNILVTHAGLHQKFIPASFEYSENHNSNEIVEKMVEFIEINCSQLNSSLLSNGVARGGKQAYGGIIWCDFYQEFEGYSEIIQVFGHTKTRIEKVIEVDPKEFDTIDLFNLKAEQEKFGFYFVKRNFFKDKVYFVKSIGVDHTFKCEHEEDSDNVTGYCIDNLEYGWGELLEYDSNTKEFNIIKKEEYEN